MIEEDARRNHGPNLSEESEIEEIQNIADGNEIASNSNVIRFHASIPNQQCLEVPVISGDHMRKETSAVESTAVLNASASTRANPTLSICLILAGKPDQLAVTSNAQVAATPEPSAPGCSKAVRNVTNYF